MATSRRRAATTSAAQATNGRVQVLQKVKRPGASVAQPYSTEHLAWFAGLTLMAPFDVIEWPVALVIAVGHEIARRARNKAIRELAEGIEAGG